MCSLRGVKVITLAAVFCRRCKACEVGRQKLQLISRSRSLTLIRQRLESES